MFDRCMSLNRCSSIGPWTVSAVRRTARTSSPKLPRESPRLDARRCGLAPRRGSCVGWVSTWSCESSAMTWTRSEGRRELSTDAASRLASLNLEPARMLNELSITSHTSLSLGTPRGRRLTNGLANASASSTRSASRSDSSRDNGGAGDESSSAFAARRTSAS